MTLILPRPAPAQVPARRPGEQRRIGWLLAVGWLVHVLARLWLTRHRAGPVANPDETGYLLAARWLAGGVPGDLSGTTFYQGGYPVLLTPAFWITHDPELAYRLVLGVNALIGAALFPLGYLALRRLGLGRRAAVPLALVIPLLPASIFYGQYALTDALLPTLVLGWLLSLHTFARGGSPVAGGVAGGAAGVLAAYALSVHMRGMVILAVHIVVMLFLLVYGRRLYGWRVRLVVMAATVVVAVGAQLLNVAARAATYPSGPRDLLSVLWTRVTTADGQLWALAGASGQLWYLIVGTWGLAGIGLVAGAAAVARRRTPLPMRVSAAALLMLTAGVAYAASAALPDEHRVANFAYGRYLTCVAIAWALAGAAVLARRRRWSVARHAVGSAVLLAVSGTATALYAGGRLRTHAYIAFDFPETSFLTGFLTGRDGGLDLVRASVTVLGLLVVLACLGRRVVLMTLAVALVNVLFFAFVASYVRPETPAWRPSPERGGVAIDRRIPWGMWVPLSHRVWWTRLQPFDPRREAPAADTCTLVMEWPEGRAVPPESGRPAGWTEAGRAAPPRGWVAWHDPAC